MNITNTRTWDQWQGKSTKHKFPKQELHHQMQIFFGGGGSFTSLHRRQSKCNNPFGPGGRLFAGFQFRQI